MDVLSEIAGVKKPVENLIPSLLNTYELIGLSKRFSVAGKSDRGITLQGKSITIAVRVEFGNTKDFFETLTYLNNLSVDYKVLVTSSNSRSLPMEAAYTVLKKKLQVKDRWMLIDIEGKKEPMKINYGNPSALPAAPHRPAPKNAGKRVRRKKIYGGKYRKKQD